MKPIMTFALAVIVVTSLSMCTQSKHSSSDEDLVDSCAVMPEFPGGQKALMDFIDNNVQYPVLAEEVGLEGNVLVGFIIEKDGSVSHVTVKESADSLLDAEAVRVVNAMPAWTPGHNEAGDAVRVRCVLPVTFQLDGSRDRIDQMPEFPGGISAYIDYMGKNLNYPAECEEKGVQGRVLVSVVIDEKGNVTHPKVLNSAHPLLMAEALRVVKMMPQWTPGKNEGKETAVTYVIPVTFRLQ